MSKHNQANSRPSHAVNYAGQQDRPNSQPIALTTSADAEPESILRGENLSFGITLGSSAGRPVFQFNDDRFRHTVIIGRTGSGKSNHMLQMEREDIRSGAGVAIIAAHEEDALYPLRCVPRERMGDVIILDPTNARMLACLNPLDVDRGNRAAISKAVDDCVHLLKSQCHFEWAGPRFEQMARLGLKTMLDPGFAKASYDGIDTRPHLALIEKMYTDPEFVRAFMFELNDGHLRDQWKLEAGSRRSSEADDKVQWFLSKLEPFISDCALKHLFGPNRKTIDIKQIVDEGKILVAVIPEQCIGRSAAAIIRTWLLIQLKDAIQQRGANNDGGYYGICAKRKQRTEPDPFFVYVDEFGEQACVEFAPFLAEARKHRVGFTLALQNLSQMRTFDMKAGRETTVLLDAVLANVGTTICYPIGSADRAPMARQLDVDEHRISQIARYQPLARVMLDNEQRLIELDAPRMPDADDPDMPELLAEEQIINNIWLPISRK